VNIVHHLGWEDKTVPQVIWIYFLIRHFTFSRIEIRA
jgi:hypothetical protein